MMLDSSTVRFRGRLLLDSEMPPFDIETSMLQQTCVFYIIEKVEKLILSSSFSVDL